MKKNFSCRRATLTGAKSRGFARLNRVLPLRHKIKGKPRNADEPGVVAQRGKRYLRPLRRFAVSALVNRFFKMRQKQTPARTYSAADNYNFRVQNIY